MAMHFLRYQEYYECSSPKFQNKSFNLFDFMEWYAQKYGNGSFTYPKDWSGFNIPGKVIEEVIDKSIPDINRYDRVMDIAYGKCKKKNGSSTFYIIGALSKGATLNHEIAHGLYYLNHEYKKQMNNLISLLPKDITSDMIEWFKSVGYPKKVWKDEMQAYLSTGLPGKLKHLEEYCKSFVATFKNTTSKNSRKSPRM